MSRILVLFVLMFVSFRLLPAEEHAERNPIEHIRELATVYDGLNAEDKEVFLSELNLTKEAFQSHAAWSRLDWKMGGTHKLPLSNSTLSIPEGYALVTGKDALDLYEIEKRTYNEDLEAYAYVYEGPNVDNAVLFENVKTGYILLNDWKEIDPKKFLEEIIENTEEENKNRKARGTPELHVIGWIQEPTLDEATKTVYWAIEADSGEEESVVNAVAIRLGREGYERIVWITPRSSYVYPGGELDKILRAHDFDSGYRYSDYVVGDKLAGYGIASLVAASVGAKALKIGGIGGIGLILKKIFGLVFAGIAGLFYKFRNLFRKKSGG